MAEKEHTCGCCHGHDHHEHHEQNDHHDHCNCGHDHQDHCECGHEHHHDSCGCGCGCGHDHHQHEDKKELPLLLLGAGLFAAGILVDLLLKNQWFSLPVFVAAYLVLGWEVLLTAGKNIVKGRVFDENFLMSIATLGAFAIGEFPEAVGVMLFYRLGEYFEHKAVARSRSQIMAAVDLRPETVTLDSGEVIPAEAAEPGDLLGHESIGMVEAVSISV